MFFKEKRSYPRFKVGEYPYRIICDRGVYHFQKKGFLWGWNDVYVIGSLHNCKTEYYREVLEKKYGLDMNTVMSRYVDLSQVKGH